MKNILFTYLITTLAASTTFADLLTYEGFDYTAAGNLDGQTGGSGWRSPTNPNWSTSDTFTITSDSLSYADAGYTSGAPATVGNAITSSGSSTRVNRILDIDSLGVWDNAGLRNGSANYIGGSGVSGSFYGSMLVSSNDWSSSRLIVEFTALGGATSHTPRLDINGGFKLTNTAAGTVTNPEGTTPAGSGTYLVVFEFNLDGDDTTSGNASNNSSINFWVNPDAGTSPAAGSIAQISTTRQLFEFNQLDIRNIGSGDVIVDEIRFGTTWADVAVVPEPSTYGLIAGLLALTGVAARRRK